MTREISKKIVLFGGSFDPPHIGHIEICKHLLDSGKYDQVWAVPCFKHPFGKPLASFDNRLVMCALAFKRFGDGVFVTDIERQLGGISHTVRTIEYLKDRYPDMEFSLIVGKDVAGEKSKWKDFDRIQKLVAIIEIPRGRDSFVSDISSTEIRRRIQDKEEFEDMVIAPVASYIKDNALYGAWHQNGASK